MSDKTALDERVKAGWPNFEKGLEVAAELAWQRTVKFPARRLDVGCWKPRS